MRIMSFQLPIREAVADMTMDEMTIRHYVTVYIEYTINDEPQPPQAIDIPIPLVVGAAQNVGTPRLSQDSSITSPYYHSDSLSSASPHSSLGMSPSTGRWQDLAQEVM